MQAGSLRSQLQFERSASVPNSYGELVKAWYVLTSSWWGGIKPLSGQEAALALSFSPTVSHRIEIRYLAGLLPMDRVWFMWPTGNRLFGINAVTDPEERRRRMVLYCTELVNSSESPSNVTLIFDTLTDLQFDKME